MQIRFWKTIYTLLLLILACVILGLLQFSDRNLHIISCNVGQGDAILIIYKQAQILTDGGPDSKVLDCLGRYMPFWDREIELVISTHPDADHSTGLVSVFQNYKVDELLINPITSGTQVYKALVSEVGGSGTHVVNPLSGQKLRLGLIYLDVLSPNLYMYTNLDVNKENNNLEKYYVPKEANQYSVVYLLTYKNFSGLFTGDITPEVSDSLAGNWHFGSVDYLKISHHGSINGLTENLLKVVMPKIAVISVGKNQWGLPKEEILNMLSKYRAKILRTDESNDIELITDGVKYWIN